MAAAATESVLVGQAFGEHALEQQRAARPGATICDGETAAANFACCAALAETVRERRTGSQGKGGGVGGSNDDARGEREEEASLNEMLVAATAALSSHQSSLEHKQKAQEDDWEDAMARGLEDTTLPLLEILRRTRPYVAHRANNSGPLLAHQFGVLSRLLRMFVALGRTMPSLSESVGAWRCRVNGVTHEKAVFEEVR